MNTISLIGTNTLLISKLIENNNITSSTHFVLESESAITLIDDLYVSSSFSFTLKSNAYLLYRHRLTNEEKEKYALPSRMEPEKSPSLCKNLTITLREPGAKAHVECISETSKYDYCAFKTLQHHCAPHTESLVITRGVAHDNSRCMSENLIRIEKEAQHTKAREEHKSLLIGDHARIISIPKLEVEADMVSCEHGAAIARLREEDLFYMQTRGIDQRQAQQLLVDAFLTHTI